MPIPIAAEALFGGLAEIPYAFTVLKALPWLILVYLLKQYFGGARNHSERNMHSKVVMMTGGTSGIGAVVARELAIRGAQLVLLTQHALTDPFLADFIMDLRAATGNELITAEHCDLASLHSIRLFATKWVDNAPPRRLDMIILCANTLTPKGGKAARTEDGLEANWGINYVANFHLLSILSPALRAQPPDRDVRIIFGMCASYLGGDLRYLLPPEDDAAESRPAKAKAKSNDALPGTQTIAFTPASAYATSKLALMAFAASFQKHLSSYSRPDQAPMNARVLVVDPGWTRTPGMRRYLTFGSLWGLLLYLVLYPVWWLVLKSPLGGAQSFLHAAMEARFGVGLMQGEGDVVKPDVRMAFVKECRQVRVLKDEAADERLQKQLWEQSERTIERLEKEGARRRAEERSMKKTDGEVAKSSGANAQKTPGSRRSKRITAGTE